MPVWKGSPNEAKSEPIFPVQQAVIMVVAVVLRNRLSEARAMTTDAFLRELLVKTPSRAISRLLPRRPVS